MKVGFILDDNDSITGSFKMLEEQGNSGQKSDDDETEKITQQVASELMTIIDFCTSYPEFRKHILKNIGLKWNHISERRVSVK